MRKTNIILESLAQNRKLNNIGEAYIRNLYVGTEVDDLFNSKKPQKGDVFTVSHNFSYFGWIDIDTEEEAKKIGIKKIGKYDEYMFPKGTRLVYKEYLGGPGGGHIFTINDSDKEVMFVFFNTEVDNPKEYIDLIAKKSYD